MQALLLNLLAHVGGHVLSTLAKIAKAGVLIGYDEALKFAKDSQDAFVAIKTGDHAGAVSAIVAEAAKHGKALLLREVNMAIEIIVAELEADLKP